MKTAIQFLREWFFYITAPPHVERALDDIETEIAEAHRQRDRLQALLDAETGERGPEGWTRLWSATVGWHWRKGGWWIHRNISGRWTYFDESDPEDAGGKPTALEAMEAADGSRT